MVTYLKLFKLNITEIPSLLPLAFLLPGGTSLEEKVVVVWDIVVLQCMQSVFLSRTMPNTQTALVAEEQIGKMNALNKANQAKAEWKWKGAGAYKAAHIHGR